MEHGEKMILLLLSLLNTETRPQKQGAPICQKLQCKGPFRESVSQTHTHRPNSIPKRRRRQINKKILKLNIVGNMSITPTYITEDICEIRECI